MLNAGKITGAYGIRGWVKIHARTESAENFLSFSRWLIHRQDRFEPIEFVEGRQQGKGLVARIAGVETRTDAELLRGLEIWIPEDELPALDAGDYYWHQLQTLRVWSEHDGESLLLGEVDHLIETGSNDVLVLKPCEGSVDTRERLIPYLPGDVVQEVDLEGQRIRVLWHPDD